MMRKYKLITHTHHKCAHITLHQPLKRDSSSISVGDDDVVSRPGRGLAMAEAERYDGLTPIYSLYNHFIMGDVFINT
jgi:hypothetical protein